MSGVTVGLRIDVDTTRGLRDGVPALVALLARHGVTATFFMSVGPDTMGRHVWRLLKPKFLWKMLRSKAASLYGWDILLSGTCWPGRVLGRHYAAQVRLARDAGHEIGLHAWDHRLWQAHAGHFTQEQALTQMRLGVEMLRGILGEKPGSSAVPGWRCTETVLLAQEVFGFAYHSDCRGVSAFVPVVGGRECAVQLPVTLPCYDEAIGQDGVTDGNFNAYILSQLKPGVLNIYTIHAEVEGGRMLAAFDDFLREASARGVCFVPLKAIAAGLDHASLPRCRLETPTISGREGWVAVQGSAV